MYRARIQAISGTKVRADGKWLKCIGNKNFRVGELIWTDGRCVYGNHFTPQQPLVITAPPDEEIPILLYNHRAGKCFANIFSKGKLKYQETENEIYTSEGDAITGTVLINDKSSKAYLGWYAPPYGSGEYWQFIVGLTGNAVEEKYFDFDGYVDANIKNGEFYSLYAKENIVQVKCGENVITEINLEPYLEQVISECENAPDMYSPHEFNDFETVAILGIRRCFMEDDKNWAFSVSCLCTKTSFAGGGGDSTEPDWTHAQLINEFDTKRDHDLYFLITSEGAEALDADNANYPLSDDYYYTQKPYLDSEGYIWIDMTIFNPSGEEIISGLTTVDFGFISVQKTKGGYLLGVYTRDGSSGMATHPFTGKRLIFGGLYFGKGENWETLSKFACTNLRFRPMAKYKNWQNRITFK